MFNFLNSAVLAAALAALIPLLIHLFSRRRVKIIPFSSLKYLKEMQKRQVRRIKIRQILLLILRMLIILMAVLAFARPATRGGYIGSHAGVSAVILFDRSASMQRQVKDGILFDIAKSRAADLLKNFGQSDEVLLIPFDRQPYFPAGERFFNREVAERILQEIVPGFDRSELSEMVPKARELLNGAVNLNKELYLISDWQRSSLDKRADSSLEGVTVYFVELPTETDGNSGLDGVDLGGQLIEVGNPFTVRTGVTNYDHRRKTEQLASLYIDGVRVMQSEFQIGPDEKTSLTFKATVTGPGFHSGWVELNDDGFLPDNRFYFSFRIPEQFNILIIDGDGAGELIRLALIPSEEAGRYWSVKRIPPEQFSSVRLSEYDAVVLSGGSDPDPMQVSQIFRFLDDGGGLFYIIGPDTKPASFNSSFGRSIDLALEKPVAKEFSGAGYYSLERFDYNHPVFKAYAGFAQEKLPTLRFYALPSLNDGGGNRDLAYFSNGLPAVVESSVGAGKIIVMTAPLTPRYSDIAAHSFFVPFIIRTMEYLAGDMSAYDLKNLVGENILRVVPEERILSGMAQLTVPGNQVYQLEGTEKAGQYLFDCRPVSHPGIYSLKAEGGTVDLFAVNIDSRESALEAADYPDVARQLGVSNYRTIPPDRSSETIVTESRYGRELWKIFLWAAALLLAVEMLLSREKEIEPEIG